MCYSTIGLDVVALEGVQVDATAPNSQLAIVRHVWRDGPAVVVVTLWAFLASDTIEIADEFLYSFLHSSCRHLGLNWLRRPGLYGHS